MTHIFASAVGELLLDRYCWWSQLYGQFCGCQYSGSSCHQVISSHYIDRVRHMSPYLPQTMISTACVHSLLRNDRKWNLFKSPWVTRGLIVFGPFPLRSPLPPSPLLFCQHFSTFWENPEANFFKPHMVDLWVWENFWHPSRWPWVKVTKLPKWDTIYFVSMIKWELLIQSLQNLVGIFLLSCFPHDWIFEKFCKKYYFSDFFCKILKPVSAVEHYIYHILGMVGPIDVKQKGNDSTGCQDN